MKIGASEFPWRVSGKGIDAVDDAVIVDRNGNEVLGVSEWVRIEQSHLEQIVQAVNNQATSEKLVADALAEKAETVTEYVKTVERMSDQIATLTGALERIQRETMRCRGEQSYKDAAKFALKESSAALRVS